jgi:hypothetical protein
MTATKQSPDTSANLAIENSQELRDALFHAICLLDHAHSVMGLGVVIVISP